MACAGKMQRVVAKHGLPGFATRKSMGGIENADPKLVAKLAGCRAVRREALVDCGRSAWRCGDQCHPGAVCPEAFGLSPQRGGKLRDRNWLLGCQPAARRGVIGAIGQQHHIAVARAGEPASLAQRSGIAPNTFADHFAPAA